MILLSAFVIAMALLCFSFYTWARRQGYTRTAARGRASHISPLTEATSYVGVILVLAGGIAAFARRWDDISAWGHVLISAAVAALFLAVGSVLLRAHEPALQRLVGVTWFLSVAGLAGAVGFAVGQAWNASGQVTVLVVGAFITGYSATLWFLRRRAPQNAALFLSLVVAICGSVATIGQGNAPALAFAVSLWAFGTIWVVAGWRRWVAPMWTTMPLGIVLALLAPSFAVNDHGWAYAVGIGTAAAVMATSVPLRNTPMLGLGAVGLFAYVTSLVIRYFADSLGVPAALALTGASILVLVVVGARLTRAINKPKSGERPPSLEQRPQQHVQDDAPTYRV